MDAGLQTFVLDLPSRLEADLLRGDALAIDATAITQAGVGASYIEAIVARETAAFLESRGAEAAAAEARQGRPARPLSANET